MIAITVAVAAAVMCMERAEASPFSMPKGEGRIIFSGFYTESPKGFDDDGDVIDIGNYTQTQLYANAEYGLTDDLNLLFTPSYRHVSLEGPDNNTSGLGYTDIGARYRVAYDANWTVSLQALARIPGKSREDRIAQIGSTDSEFDLRAQVGYVAGPTFVAVEGGYRLRSDDPPNEFKADITVGTRVAPELLLLGSVYNTISDGGGRDIFADSFRCHTASVSAVYDVSDRFSIQAGLTATVAGKNALRERGPTLGLWYRF